MSDISSINVYQIISSIGTIVAVIISVTAVWRASKQKHTDQLDKIENKLNEHVLQDEHDITELQTQVKSLTDNVNGKLDIIIRELDK